MRRPSLVSPFASRSWVLPSTLLVFLIFTHMLFMDIPEWGGDALTNWFHAKQVASGTPIDHWSHHTARLAILLPASMFAWLFDLDPIAYPIWPMIGSVCLGMLLFASFSRRGAVGTGVVATLLIGAFPETLRHGTQLLPGIFAGLFLVLGVYLLEPVLDRRDAVSRAEERRAGVATGSVFFIAYLSYEMTLFLLPGVAWVLWRKDRRRTLIWMAGILLVGYLAETAFYVLHLGNRLGRIDIIRHNHFATLKRMGGGTGFQIGKRFWAIDPSWRFLMYLGLISMALSWVRGRLRSARDQLWACGLVSFLFFLTFAVKSIDPVITVVRQIPRYFMPVAPFLAFFAARGVCALVSLVARRVSGREPVVRSGRGVAVAILSVVVVAWALEGFRSPVAAIRDVRFMRAKVNSHWEKGDVVAVRADDWKKLKYVVYRLWLNPHHWKDPVHGTTLFPETWLIQHGDSTYLAARNKTDMNDSASKCDAVVIQRGAGARRALKARPMEAASLSRKTESSA